MLKIDLAHVMLPVYFVQIMFKYMGHQVYAYLMCRDCRTGCIHHKSIDLFFGVILQVVHVGGLTHRFMLEVESIRKY